MRLDETQARARFAAARVARLASRTPADQPHLVPIVFVVADAPTDSGGSGSGATIYTAVDAKPKRTTALQRLANVAAHPAVSVLADHYEDDDWSRLWWVRADGVARQVHDAAERDAALALLTARYPQYERDRPPGPVLAIDVRRWTGWAATGDPPLPSAPHG